MAIDPNTETLRPLAEAAARLPALRGGRPVHTTTVWRWATRGVRGRGGQTVKLETLKVGGTCVTSDEALVRYFLALSTEQVATGQLPAPENRQPSPRFAQRQARPSKGDQAEQLTREPPESEHDTNDGEECA